MSKTKRKHTYKLTGSRLLLILLVMSLVYPGVASFASPNVTDPYSSNIGTTTTDIVVQANEQGTLFTVLTTGQGANTLTPAQVEAGNDWLDGSGNVHDSGSISITSGMENTNQTISLGSPALTPGTTYTFNVVLKNTSSAYSTVKKYSFTPGTGQTFTVAPAFTKQYANDTIVQATTDANGSLYVSVFPDGTNNVTFEEVLKQGSTTIPGYVTGGSEANSSGVAETVALSGLTIDTAYDVYVVAYDGQGAPAGPVKLDLTAQGLKLLSATYDKGSVLSTSDDSITLSWNIATSFSGSDTSFAVRFDGDASGGFSTADLTLVDADYTVSAMSGTDQTITFTAAGAAKLDAYSRGYFQVELLNLTDFDVHVKSTDNKKDIGVTGYNAKLSALSLQGTSVPSFSSSNLTYSIVTTAANTATLQGDTSALLISATKEDSAASVTTTLETSPNDHYKVRVTAENGLFQDYLVNFSADDYELTDLTVGGSQIQGFDPLKKDYNIMLTPLGTTTVPTIVLDAENGSVSPNVITSPPDSPLSTSGSLPGILTHTYQHQIPSTSTQNFVINMSATENTISNVSYNLQGTASKTDDTFGIQFSLDVIQAGTSSDYQLEIDENATSTFSSATTTLTGSDFSIDDVSGDTVLFVLTSSGQSKLSNLKGGVGRVTVTNPSNLFPVVSSSGNTATVTVPSSNADLSAIAISNRPVKNFSPSTTSYTVPVHLNEGYEIFMSNYSAVTYSKAHSGANVVMGTSSPVLNLTVTAQDSLTTKTYGLTINEDQYGMDDIKVNGTTISGFDPFVKSYSVTLPTGTSGLPNIQFTPHNESGPIDIQEVGAQSPPLFTMSTPTVSGSLPGTMNVSITVTKMDTSPQVFSFVFTAASASSSSGSSDDGTTSSNQEESTGSDGLSSTLDTLTNISNPDPEIVDKVIEFLIEGVDEAANQDLLVNNMENLATTLGNLDELQNKNEEEGWAQKQLETVTETFDKNIARVEDEEKAVQLTLDYIDAVGQLHEDSQVQKTAGVSGQLESVANRVSENIGKTKPAFTEEKEDDQTILTPDPDQLVKDVEEKAKLFKQVEDKLTGYFGEDNVRDLAFQVTIEAPKVEDQIAVILDPAVVTNIEEQGVAQLGVDVDGTRISVDTKDLPKTQIAQVQLRFDDKPTNVPTNAYKSGHVIDVNYYVGSEEKSTLDAPASLQFDLSKFEFDEELNADKVSIFRLNEETGIWEPVGGVYDPVTKTIKTRRITLSQYTVMQTNKTYNDVENSWAQKEINALLNKGVLEQTASFTPEEGVTRKEFATWMTRAYGVTKPGAELPFEDIEENDQNYSELASGYEAGIFSGRSAETFDPDSVMTREELAAMLGNAMINYDQKKLNFSLQAKLNKFVDNGDNADWSEDYLALVVELDLLPTDGEELDPDGAVSKELAASILKKIYG